MSTLLQQLVNGLSLGSIYGLIALGYTMVYVILRLINFAHGDVYMVGAYVGYYISAYLRGQPPSFLLAGLVMLGSVAACAALGLVIERFAYRPVRHASKMTSLITAIGVSLLLENLAQLVFGATPQSVRSVAPSFVFPLGEVAVKSEDLTIFVVSLLVAGFLYVLVMKTKTGIAMRAVSYNLDAAKLMGVPTDRIIAVTFALGSGFAAIAGVLVGMAIPQISPLMGIMYGLKAFVAAVLGGIGNIWGALLGGLLIGLAETFVVGYLSPTYRDAIAFAILILLLLFRPQGILGRVVREKV
jgi:branched-chain amino acid transport system permease protein